MLKELKKEIKEVKFEIKHKIKGEHFCFFSDFENGNALRKLERLENEYELLKEKLKK